MRKPTRSLLLAVVLGLSLGTAGCGSKTEGTAAAKPATPTARKPQSPLDQLSPNLVTAVLTGKSGAGMLQLKFELAGPPTLGNPVDMDVVIVPTADNLEQISGTIQGEDGLEVVAGDAIAPLEKPTYGNPVHHPLKLIAKRDGIYTLTATMSVATGGQVLTPVFSIPVIGGNGSSDVAAPAPGRTAAKPAPTTAAR
jgi:hypothetical protein